MCFVKLEKAFDRVLIKVVGWAMRKKEIPEMMVKAVMNLFKEAISRIKVKSGYSDELPVKVGVPKDQYCHRFYLQL